MAHIKKRGKKSWQISIDLGRDKETGKRIRITETVRGKKQDAELRLSEIYQELKLCNFNYKKPEKVTLEENLLRFLDMVKNQVRTRTWERYEDICKKHLIPALGDKYLTEITAHMIQDYYSQALTDGRLDGKSGGLSPTTIRQHHVVLKSALHYAVENLRLITHNPAASVKPPKKHKKEINCLSVLELQVLLNFIKENEKNLYMPVYLTSYTGARLSEVLPIRWQDIDMENLTLTISRSLQQSKEGLHFDDVKTSSSKRQIALTEENVKTLKKHQEEQILRKTENYADQDLICAKADGSPLRPFSVSSRFRTIAEVLNFPISFHCLRHSHATILIKSGIPIKFISARLGHSSTSFTQDVYGHRTLTDDHNVAEKFNSMLNPEHPEE